MAFSDFPFPPSTPLFPKADVVASYLKFYAKTFGLYKCIRFNERVVKVEYESDSGRWTLHTTGNITSPPSEPSTYTSDLLFICNGHHNIPRYPHISGIDTWLSSNRSAHSVFYRNPKCAPWMLDETHKVLVVGGGPSGQDIVSELISRGQVNVVVHSSSKHTGEDGDHVGRVKRRGRLLRFLDVNEGKVEFEGDVTENGINYVILATGYEVQFPFLSEKYMKAGFPQPVPPLPTGVWNTTCGVFPLARYLFPFSFNTGTSNSPPSTSVFFLGLLVRVVPMPLVQVQAHVALALFANKLTHLDWRREAKDVLVQYDHLKAQLGNDHQIHKAWFRFEPMEQFAYRDALVDLLYSSLGEGRVSQSVRRVQAWEREIYSRKGTLRKAWQALEANGDATEFLRGIGEGNGGKSVEDEWVDLMGRVLKIGEIWKGDASPSS